MPFLFSSYYLRKYFQTKGGLFINTAFTKNPQRTKYDTIAIKSAADSYMVARAIGMDIQDNNRTSKNKVSILCPGHDDRHHGSCFLTQTGCHCYVCNKDFDLFDMVMLHCSVNFPEAAGMVADLCGGRERFRIEDTDYIGNDDDYTTGGTSSISRSDMQLIGVFSTPVYIAREAVPDWAEPERTRGTRHIWCPGDIDKPDSDYVVIEECIVHDPLRELLREDPQEYFRLIRNKAWETLKEKLDWQSFARKISRPYARTLIKDIRKIEEIIIEHGGSLKEPP